MPRSFALAAALASVLAVTACGAAQPDIGAQPAPLSADSSESADAAEQVEPDASASEPGSAAQDGALRYGTMGIAEQADPGEPGLPSHSGASIDDVLRLGAVATWIDAPDVLAVSLPASSDCWPSAAAPVVQSPTRLSIEFAPGAACGGFDTARTYTIEVPAGIDEGASLDVEIGGLEHNLSLTLPAN